jgi:drug/metabolite transporter (DMT)-like permease
MRSAVIVPMCLVLGGPKIALRALASPIRLQLLWRSLVLVAAWISYFTASRYLPLATLTTIYFSSPLLVAILAMPMLKERVTPARWASLAIGFAGVVIACRPGRLEESGAVALALAAAGLWAYTAILIRQIVHAEPTPVLLFASNLTILAVCGSTMPVLWQAPSAGQFALMLLVGALGAAGQFLQTEAIRRAPATVVAPLSFPRCSGPSSSALRSGATCRTAQSSPAPRSSC